MIFLWFRLLPLLQPPFFPGYCFLDCCIPPPGILFLHGLANSRDPAVLAALLFHCFRKYCPFRLFTIFHVVDDTLGIILNYSLVSTIDFVFSPMLYFLLVLRSITTNLCCDTTASPGIVLQLIISFRCVRLVKM